jgi:CPA1 family monovalent cation:H+ antiporter
LEIRGRVQKLDDPKRVAQFRTRLRRMIADIDHLLAEPLGPREGAVVVWAGARGAVTLAAAQTLPETTPHRSLLVFVAFLVAAGSLLLQGGTLPLLVRWIKPTRADPDDTEERTRLVGRLLAANREVLEQHTDDPAMQAFRERLEGIERVEPDPNAAERVRVRLEMIEAQRATLLAAREEGTFSSEVLTSLLDTLDAEPISIEMRADGAEPR